MSRPPSRPLLLRGTIKYADGKDIDKGAEIYAYIEKIKKYLNNVQIKTPLQLIESQLYTHENIEHENKFAKQQKKAHLFADKLFVYDYITIRIKENQAYNASCKIDLDETIKEIEKEEAMSYSLEKTEKIKEAKRALGE